MEGARIKVLIADLFSAAAKAELEKEFDVKYDDKLNGETLKSALSEFKPEILVVRGTKVTGEMMETDPHLAYVVRAGQGFDTIEFNWAAQHGIYVANCPGILDLLLRNNII
jgi:D-3-phosphoglycerate dehydrogenase / 2-oxoglutarate reductase